MYEYGNGVGINVKQAIYWYKKSAEQGDEDAQNKLKKLSEKWIIYDTYTFLSILYNFQISE